MNGNKSAGNFNQTVIVNNKIIIYYKKSIFNKIYFHLYNVTYLSISQQIEFMLSKKTEKIILIEEKQYIFQLFDTPDVLHTDCLAISLQYVNNNGKAI